MIEPHPSALAVLSTVPLTCRNLFAALPEGPAADLAAELDPTDVPIDRDALLDAAREEAERHGHAYVLREDVVLGWVRLTGSRVEHARIRLQALIADRAHASYLALRPTDPHAHPTAVLVAGIPGCGKSTLAESLARHLRAPVFSMDWLLGALVPFRVLTQDNATPIADVQVTAATARQLQLGLSVVLDATGHTREARDRLRTLTEALGGRFVGVECVCTDDQVLRERVEGRARGIPGWHDTVEWEHVLRMRDLWEPWTEPHLVIDSATTSPEEALRQALSRCAGP
ncbi:AAA family ATPase [Umezawaea sp. NPDC059074]|uniref:AAA family ATPase n=1 Tax=Umezawaea sp. NPDC059074 TaxID=3346716 RepID=UPI0036742AF7